VLRRGVGPDAGQADPAGGGPGKLLSPARRRACIEHVRRERSISERRACAVLGHRRGDERRRGGRAIRLRLNTSSRLRKKSVLGSDLSDHDTELSLQL
jgi:hypothetical protein